MQGKSCFFAWRLFWVRSVLGSIFVPFLPPKNHSKTMNLASWKPLEPLWVRLGCVLGRLCGALDHLATSWRPFESSSRRPESAWGTPAQFFALGIDLDCCFMLDLGGVRGDPPNIFFGGNYESDPFFLTQSR